MPPAIVSTRPIIWATPDTDLVPPSAFNPRIRIVFSPTAQRMIDESDGRPVRRLLKEIEDVERIFSGPKPLRPFTLYVDWDSPHFPNQPLLRFCPDGGLEGYTLVLTSLKGFDEQIESGTLDRDEVREAIESRLNLTGAAWPDRMK
jgi:hypothetical protein